MENKTLEYNISVMQGKLAGKEIEVRQRGRLKWEERCGCPLWDWIHFDYRIKPEPKEPTYRPYNEEELNDLVGTVIRHKETKDRIVVLRKLKNCVYFPDTTYEICNYTAEELFNYFTKNDGTPCGIEVKEEEV